MDRIEQQIEKLAIAIANGFDEIHKRLDGVETRLTELEHRVGDLRNDTLDVRLSMQNLGRNGISLAEHRELRTRVLRIEDKLGTPHEL